MDLKNENEISLGDIGSEDEYKFEKFDRIGDDEDDAEGIDDLYEFWVDSEN